MYQVGHTNCCETIPCSKTLAQKYLPISQVSHSVSARTMTYWKYIYILPQCHAEVNFCWNRFSHLACKLANARANFGQKFIKHFRGLSERCENHEVRMCRMSWTIRWNSPVEERLHGNLGTAHRHINAGQWCIQEFCSGGASDLSYIGLFLSFIFGQFKLI